MLVARLVILTLILCGAERAAFPTVLTRSTAHAATPVITASFRHELPAEDSDAPLQQADDDLDSDTDCADVAVSSAALPLEDRPPGRPSGVERSPSLSGATQMLYSLKRLRI